VLVIRRLSFLLLSIVVNVANAADVSWGAAQQMVLVTTADWDANSGSLQTFERNESGWKAVTEPRPVTIGRAGSAWGIGLHPAGQAGPVKQEGDGRSPAGVFRIGTAFGYASTAPTGLRYQGMTESDYCIDVSNSSSYNLIVDANVVGQTAVSGSTEPMRRDLHANGDQRYKLGFVIEHNPNGKPAAGSCIFAHLWRQPGEATAGCTAMEERSMSDLMRWLSTDRNPVFVLLPQAQYVRLKDEWRLP
jgi:L,D-peptidoglycan transpeptidase YkuD (ErfK/YbiS/YcfS/YnhG family)